MLRYFCVLLLLAGFASHASAQSISAEDKAIVRAARARYYNLVQQGFQSATCQIHFDLSTIPNLQGKEMEDDRKGLAATRFILHLEDGRPLRVQAIYPGAPSGGLRPDYAEYAERFKAVATGFFSTWASKGLAGPFPAYDSRIDSVETTSEGYSVVFNSHGGQVRLDMDKNYLVTKISSVERNVEEKPVYIASPDGLTFASDSLTGEFEETGTRTVHYEIESSLVDGLRLPSSVHFRLGPAMELKFTLSNCEVTKGKAVEAAPQ